MAKKGGKGEMRGEGVPSKKRVRGKRVKSESEHGTQSGQGCRVWRDIGWEANNSLPDAVCAWS